MPEIQRLIDMLPALLPGHGRIMDVGCGNGDLVHRLRRLGYDAFGIDPQVDEMAGHEALIPGEAAHLPVEQGLVQVALMVNSFHHVPPGEMDRALGEIAYALAPGGRLIVVEPLAEGGWFELLRPLEDETEMRAAAEAAIERASIVGFVHANPHVYLAERRAADLEEVLEAFVAAEPGRGPGVGPARAEVARRFASTGRADGEGRVFLQPMRLDILDLPAGQPVVRFAHDDDERSRAFEVRQAVFCDEQGVSIEGEFDGLDDACEHLVATMGQRIVGAARIRPYGENGSIGKIERVAVLKEARGTGMGERLVRFASEVLQARGHRILLLNAQVHAERFYRRLGYLPEGELFDDEGIPHIAMLRRN
ncbi:MAG TPA: GNAT family N-acetyltransferase [Geminicoccus sp.]|jgi:predicted GNAT family N-acyltransferase|uniref:GNAT family N-acetyltransferase n=1 Tax=Geminicoccus sp. TaxID=2024832 RepID=UPI002E30D231|nr:GNAT family N-acetyltransferase [Geminicoccus sp.]HEX2525234.1 GNAT family N-acetyltransferase [Geminicoccus sp.]